MAATTPYRITPNLGPDLWQTATQFYWDTIADPANAKDPSYQLGTTVVGNDGAEYTFVQAGAAFAADDGLSINQTTWSATADATAPVFEAPVAVASGDYFHARRIMVTTSA